MQNEIEIELPYHEPKLGVEAYLIPDSMFRVMLTESTPYMASPEIVYVSGAEVTISYLNQKIVLEETSPGYYVNPAIVPSDYHNDFYLTVVDSFGRVITGKTKIIPPKNIDSVRFLFNSTDRAAIAIYYDNDISIREYYHVYLLYHSEIFTTNENIPLNSPLLSDYVFKKGNEVTVMFMNISEEYYDFLASQMNASESNNRPLTEPAPLKSNVTGGLGIFTGMQPMSEFYIVE